MPFTIIFHIITASFLAVAEIAADFHEPSNNNWFATMVERIDDEVTDQEIFDSSVITID
jgi:hypothetical protein